MEEQQTDFVKLLVSAVVKSPESVEVNRTVDEQGILFHIIVASGDMPLVIGRQGNNIKAIALIVRLYGRKSGESMNLRVEEPNGIRR